VATSTPSRASEASRKSRKLDDSDTRKPINDGQFRLRALWTPRSVEVRVLSGAW
jgi:hypothetical protein